MADVVANDTIAVGLGKLLDSGADVTEVVSGNGLLDCGRA